MTQGADAPSRARILAAFLAVYVIWGSTYLAIRVAIDTMPPLLMAGVRFGSAGLLLYVWMLFRTKERPTAAHWRSAFIAGGLMLVGGNGGVVLGERTVPSGVAALLIATVPLWIVILSRTRPTGRLLTGVLLGFAGVALLLGPKSLGGEPVDPAGAAIILTGAFLWANGSLFGRTAPLPSHPLLSVAMQMLGGGLLQILAGLVLGEARLVHPGAFSVASVAAFAYLVFFGSLIGFTSYVWLLKVVSPAKAATYAYVNPLVAVLLGRLFRDEPAGPRTLAATVVIVIAVILITARPAAPARAATRPARSAP